MKTLLTTLTAFAIVTIATATGAQALPIIGKGDLNRHCVAKYQPRGIQAMADPYTATLSGQLRCRLTSGFGFTNENQSNSEVCQRLTGSARWTNNGNRVRCVGNTVASTPPVVRLVVPNQLRIRRCTRWVWNGRAFACK